jgi:hypothetical protein
MISAAGVWFYFLLDATESPANSSGHNEWRTPEMDLG